MSERKANQTFVYTGSTEYSFDNVILDTRDGLAPYRPIYGYGGIDQIPYDGATVTMRTGEIGAISGVKDLQPTMNNKLYYLVSNTLYGKEDIETVKSLATEVTVSIVSGKYEGSFVFSNPDNLENLYLIWDYADNMEGGSASYSGGEVTKYIDVDYGSKNGLYGVSYNVTDTPARVLIKNGTTIVADTGYIGLNTTANYDDLIDAGVNEEDINLTLPLDGLVNNGVGSLLTQKKAESINSKIIVESPLSSTAWALTTELPTRTSFYVDTTPRDTAAETEADCPTTEFFHDGTADLPVPGDTLYVNNDTNQVAPGGDKYYLADIVTCTGPSTTTSRWISVNDLGVVTNTGNPHVTCTEVAIPVITQIDIDMLNSTFINLCIEATNNPTSWTVTSGYNDYEIVADECGAIFGYTNYLGEAVTDVIGKNITRRVSSTTLPAVTSGAATITLIEPNLKGLIPPGVTLDTTSGTLSGTPTETGIYTLPIQAENCFGISLAVNIDITVSTAVNLNAFGIDSEEPQSSSALAIALAPASYDIMYHNGTATLPVIGDLIYSNAEATERIVGNDQWYRLNSSASAFQIDATGRLIDIV